MIGDTDKDARAGLAAGVRTILVEHPGTAEQRAAGAFAAEIAAGRLWRVATLGDAARLVVESNGCKDQPSSPSAGSREIGDREAAS
jgi:beta-phosphoglucomutase-like phosphatase (HAD superfamily)